MCRMSIYQKTTGDDTPRSDGTGSGCHTQNYTYFASGPWTVGTGLICVMTPRNPPSGAKVACATATGGRDAFWAATILRVWLFLCICDVRGHVESLGRPGLLDTAGREVRHRGQIMGSRNGFQ